MSTNTTFKIIETFTKSEFLLMCSIMNGVGCSPETFIINIIEGMELENIAGIDIESFLQKLNDLEEWEISELYEKVSEFWETPFSQTDAQLAEMGINFEN